ncbi:PRC-barrel domain containing protein [Sphingomonas baiyangensis]|uniref:PRC-barrel domain containing protein n=2 Tax=Sphingomonas baiyangensis TaxID=2572576 RepID=A0A4U1L9W1_9SPHN|nr:PRC-barrel domain containing protein [Sphingomonas baiyangensis]
MIAAMMTAANLGARITGSGFIVFTIGSVAWCVVGMTSGQTNLVVTNGFLTLVNAVGIWRWLGRQARYDKGGERAAKDSTRPEVDSLFAGGTIAGAKLVDGEGKAIGEVVDAMLRCHDHAIEYLVVSLGGVAGVGEHLHALDPARVTFAREHIRFEGGADDARGLPRIAADDWPDRLPRDAA